MPRLNAFDLALNTQWAMQEDALSNLLAIARREGPWRIEAALEQDADPAAVSLAAGKKLDNTKRCQVRDGVAIILVMGPIFRRANMLTDVSGATSIEMVARDLAEAVQSPNVKAILLDIDSPGGQVNGTGELASIIAQANKAKPVHCYSGGLCASAAYWLASACETITIARTTSIGSIGVIAAFAGKDPDEIEMVSDQSPDKSPDLTTAAGRAPIQRVLNDMAAVFVEQVAQNRGVPEKTVLSDFGKGGMLVGRTAVKAGMADRIGTFEGTLRRLSNSPASMTKRTPRAEEEWEMEAEAEVTAQDALTLEQLSDLDTAGAAASFVAQIEAAGAAVRACIERRQRLVKANKGTHDGLVGLLGQLTLLVEIAEPRATESERLQMTMAALDLEVERLTSPLPVGV